MMIKASIIGITGYTGLELLRLLLAHPDVAVRHLTARVDAPTPLKNLYPHLAHLDFEVRNTDALTVAKDSDVVFVALPHKAAQDIVAAMHGHTRIIDLSADFRLDDPAVYAKYYETHKHPQLLKDAVYGLPEITGRDKIKQADLVANPGCFALLAQLLLYPFRGQIAHADIFAITGSSGAGKTPGEGTHHPVRSHNIRSYNVNKHRHIPEILRTAKITESQLNFVPASGPFTRGIYAQAFITTAGKASDAGSVYACQPFIRMQDEVALANIVGSNYADLSFAAGQDGRVLAQGALDNIVKGAGGTAVHNMNIMFGLEETAGLSALAPVYP